MLFIFNVLSDVPSAAFKFVDPLKHIDYIRFISFLIRAQPCGARRWRTDWNRLPPGSTSSDLAVSFTVLVVPFIRVPVGQSCLPVSVSFACLIPFPVVFLGRGDRDNYSYCVFITKDVLSIFT